MTSAEQQIYITANQQEYGRYYEYLRFPTPAQAVVAEQERS